MVLRTKDLCFTYRDHEVLNQISVTLKSGEIVSILGPNGVGKTTLLKCLNGTLRHKSGVVLIGVDSVSELKNLEIARRIGYVPQRSETGRVTVFDAILLGRFPHIDWDPTINDYRIVNRVLSRLGMDTLRLAYLDEISSGELQKVAIARAIVQMPQILLLDEPTSNLDLKNQIEILSMIRKIVQEFQVSVLMSMHDLNSAFRYSDRFICMHEGRVCAQGRMDMLTEEVIHKVYDVSVTLMEVDGIKIVIPKF